MLLDGGVFLLFSYGLMILHECAHVLAALSLKCNVEKVVIYPFGCEASVSQHHHLSLVERILLYGAGPFVHLVMAAALELLLRLDWISIVMHEYLLTVNLNTLLFNLFPVYPLDGYHIAHALLLSVLPYRRALILSIILSFAGLGLLYQFRPAESFVYVMCLGLLLLIQIIKLIQLKKEMKQFYLARYAGCRHRDDLCHSQFDLFVYKQNWILRNEQILSEKALLKKLLKLEGK